jgi:hypothetical protein
MSAISVDGREFINLATFVMINDEPCVDVDIEIIHSLLDQIAINCLGFDNWIQAYHSIDENGECKMEAGNE